jgi:hypothetical protein
MAKLAFDETQDESLRIQCHKEVAQYVHAKRKAVEVNLDMDGELVHKIEHEIVDPKAGS